MKFKVPITLITISVFSFAACGSPPLVMPENIETAPGSAPSSQPEQAVGVLGGSAQSPLARPTATVEVVGGNARSPLAPPTATAVIKPTEVVATPTAMPFFITPIYSPTPAPSPTPTPTFEPLSDKPIMGYVFGQPEELQGVDNRVNFKIIGWVPGSSEEMVVIGDDFLDVVNILNGEKQRLAEWNTENLANVGDRVWVSPTKTAALILFNLQTNRYEFWTSASGEKPIKQPYLTNVASSFIPIGSYEGVGVYDFDSQNILAISDKGDLITTKTQALQPIPGTDNAQPYNITKLNEHVVYFNKDAFLALNLKTEEIRGINLAEETSRSLSAWDAKWGWDGGKIALLLSEREPTLNFMDLYIYDYTSNKLKKMETPFTRFIKSFTWASDNRHIIVNAVIGEAEYQTSYGESFVSSKQALFIADTITMENAPLPIFFPDMASSVGEVLWSSDGKYLIARYRFYKDGIFTFRIEVKSP